MEYTVLLFAHYCKCISIVDKVSLIMTTSHRPQVLSAFLLERLMTTPHHPQVLSACLVGLLLAGCVSPQGRQATQPSHPEAQASSEGGGWLEPWPDHHESQHESPYVHGFGLEPAFLDRDVFLDFRTSRGPEDDEIELAMELEWALTRRIGLVLEAPYEHLSLGDGQTPSGLGDLAVGLRLLLVESPDFLLSSNLEVALPSGSESKGLGSGEVGGAPSFSAWFNLGNRLQASVQVGTEHGFESEDLELFYAGALAYSLPFDGQANSDSHDHSTDHSPSGLTSVMLEYTGRTVLHGELDGRDTAEVLLGLSHSVTQSWAVRGAYQVAIGDEKDFDRAVLVGLVYHF